MARKRYENGSVARRITALERRIDRLAAEHLPPPRKSGPLHRAADRIENNGLTRIAAAIGIWLFGATVWALWADMQARTEERQARAEEAEFRQLAQIATAWEVLLTPVGGDIGKGNALNTLLRAGQSLHRADLSCAAVGEFRDGTCVNPPVYNNINAFEGDFEELLKDSAEDGPYTALSSVHFQGARINRLWADGFEFSPALRGVEAFGWQLVSPSFDLTDLRAADTQRLSHSAAAAGFTCSYCRIHGGRVPLDFVLGFTNSTLAGTIVHVPLD